MTWVIRLFLLCCFLDAFAVSRTLPDGLILPKTIFLWVLGALALFLLSFIIYLKKSSFQICIADILVFLLLCLSPLLQALFLGRWHYELITDISLLACYLFIRIAEACVRGILLVHWLTEVLFMALVFLLLISAMQYGGWMPSYHGAFRVTGMFFNPGPYAIYFASLTIYAFVMVLVHIQYRRWWFAVLWIVPLMGALHFILQAQSRSAWLGIGLGMAMLLFIMWKSHHSLYAPSIQRLTRIRAVALAICLLLAISLMLYAYRLKRDSADGRRLIWQASLHLIMERPFGVGNGFFAANYLHAQAEYLRSTGSDGRYGRLAGDNRYAFNDFLQCVAEGGWWAGLASIALFVFLLVRVYKWRRIGPKEDWRKIGIYGGSGVLVCIAIAGMTAYPLQMAPIALLFWLMLALVINLTGPNSEKKRQKPVYPRSLIILPLTFSIMLGVFTFTTITKYLEWVELRKLGEQVSIDKWRQLVPYLGTEGEFMQEWGGKLLEEGSYKEALDAYQKASLYSPGRAIYYGMGNCYETIGDYLKAAQCYRLIGDAQPHLLGPRYHLAMLYYRKGERETFLALARQALDSRPKIENVEVRRMRDELRLKMSEVW